MYIIAIIILIYNRHKPIDLISLSSFKFTSQPRVASSVSLKHLKASDIRTKYNLMLQTIRTSETSRKKTLLFVLVLMVGGISRPYEIH
jgi:hypothetical protein